MPRPPNKARSLNLAFDKRFIFLGRNSGIHGLGHLFRENAHFLARLFWFVILLVSLGCLYILLVPLLERGAEVSYTAETRYLPWTTAFPAVTVCEVYSAKQAQKRLVQLYPDMMKGLTFDLQRYITDLSFNNKAVSCRKGLCDPCGEKIPCDLDWRKLIEKVRKNCTDILSDCKTNGHPFSCCDKFRQVDSEGGPCYSFNTLQSENSNNEPLFSMNRSTGPGVITFHILSDAHISVHSTEELSTSFLDDKFIFEARPSLRLDNNIEYIFSMVDFENDPMLTNDDIERRGCRYLHEVPDGPFDTYKVYSYGACKVAHETSHAYKHCGCIHPARDLAYKDKFCDYNGMNCLVNYENQKKLGLKEEEDPDEVDHCLPSCVESELTTVHLSKRWIPGDPVLRTNVTIQMAGLPTVRFQRNLLRTQLDLVVSVGGLVGLFFGASIFSLVEILYLFIRKSDYQ